MTNGGPQRTGPPPNLDWIVVAACRDAGIPTNRYRLLRHFANAVYLIEDVSVVARVAYGTGSIGRSRTAVTVADWLAAQSLPVTEPATVPSGAEQPIVPHAGTEIAVTFWRYYPQPRHLTATAWTG